MKLLPFFLLLFSLSLGYACSVNETLYYIELNQPMDLDFEAYIDLPFLLPNIPHYVPTLNQLNSSVFVYIQNQLNGSFYIYELGVEQLKLFRHTWSIPLTKKMTIRIISMFPSTVYSNVSTLYSYCLPKEEPPLNPKTIKMNSKPIPFTRNEQAFLISLILVGIALMWWCPSVTVPARMRSK